MRVWWKWAVLPLSRLTPKLTSAKRPFFQAGDWLDYFFGHPGEILVLAGSRWRVQCPPGGIKQRGRWPHVAWVQARSVNPSPEFLVAASSFFFSQHCEAAAAAAPQLPSSNVLLLRPTHESLESNSSCLQTGALEKKQQQLKKKLLYIHINYLLPPHWYGTYLRVPAKLTLGYCLVFTSVRKTVEKCKGICMKFSS